MMRAVLPMGERAVLVELDDLDAVLGLHAALAASVPDGVDELVPAARTLLVRFDPRRIAAPAVRRWVADADAATVSERVAGEIVIEVRYDGPDLDDTARMLGVATETLVARHTATEWRVAFTGFAPGFGYLVGEGWPYDIPRLDAPRTRVPAGSVALAAGFTGAYPRATPGGWRIIGESSAPLFDPAAEQPALLAPGARVRFVAVRPDLMTYREAPGAEPGTRDAPPAPGAPGAGHGPASPRAQVGATPDAAAPALRIERATNATIQDLGRPVLAHIGVGRSGALDRAALRLANRLVGNAQDAAGIEIAPGGFAATAGRDLWFAVSGAWAPLVLAGRAVDAYRAHLWRAGERLEVGIPAHGARAYLALRGGLAVPAVLGSRATDTLAGLGPDRLVAGSALAVGGPLASVPPPAAAARVAGGDPLAAGGALAGPVPPLDVAPWGWPPDVVELRIGPGPRAGWFTASARRALVDALWTVTADADRVGMRLDGPALERSMAGELPSEGMVPGALQVPPAGRPVILLADGPVTGGYPVIAVVDDRDLDLLAQAPPGARLRFRNTP